MVRILRLTALFILLVICGLFARGAFAETSLEDLDKRVSDLEKQTKKDDNTFRAFWKGGPKFETADKNYTFAITGRIQNDWLFNVGDNGNVSELIGPLNDGNEIRRAYFGFAGSMNQVLDFKSEMDFAASGAAKFQDVFMTLKKLPAGVNLRIGQFKEPISIEQIVSDNYIPFIERGLPNALTPGRGSGVMLFSSALGQRMTWAAALVRNADANGNRTEGSAGGEYNYTARVTGVPVYLNDGSDLVHLGAGFSRRMPNDDKVRYQSRPEIHLGPQFIDTGTIEKVTSVDMVNLELAAVHGPLTFQAEYFYNNVNTERNNPKFSGEYAFISYFMTGETRPYNTGTGLFDAVKPLRNFNDGKGGRGAWETLFRVSQLDLQDAPVKGGELIDLTFGLNWYLNPNARIMFNFIHYYLREKGPDTESGNNILTRFQINW